MLTARLQCTLLHRQQQVRDNVLQNTLPHKLNLEKHSLEHSSSTISSRYFSDVPMEKEKGLFTERKCEAEALSSKPQVMSAYSLKGHAYKIGKILPQLELHIPSCLFSLNIYCPLYSAY